MNPNIVELVNPDPLVVCCFCSRHEINAVEWGPMYKLGDIVLHYFCMLFSCGLKQDGQDDQGVLGFLPKDIRKEVSRGRKLKCRFCRKHTATVGCIVAKCKASFHYPCGLENGTLHQFQNDFASYCATHKPKQRIPKSAEWVCPICMVEVDKEIEAVWPPCCGKSVFHRSCIMHAAKQAGYFFKCPLCNCTNEFLDAMKANGVYVPEQDAAWETTPGAFAELMEHYTNCDAERCLCPQGRTHDDNEDRNWKIIRCNGCGASAIHVECGDLRVYSWKCSTCDNVLKAISERKDVSSDGIPPPVAGAASVANGQESESEETSSESESESSEESSEVSESSDSDEGVRISRNIPNATKLLRRRLQLQQQEEELESDNENADGSDTEEPLNKPRVYNLKFGKRYTIHGDHNDGDEETENNATTDETANVIPSAPPKPIKRISRYNQQNQETSESGGVTTTPPTKLTAKRKFLSPLNRIRNPHLINTPTYEKRLERLRQTQHELSQSQSQSQSQSESQGSADSNMTGAVDLEQTKTKSRLNSQLSPEELAEKAKLSEDCIKQKLADGQRPRLDLTGLPRIPKIAPGDKPQVSLTGRKSILGEPSTSATSQSQEVNSNTGKPSGQLKLDNWLIRKPSLQETASKAPQSTSSSHSQNSQNTEGRSDRSRSPIIIPVDVHDDDMLGSSFAGSGSAAGSASGSGSSVITSSIIESLKAKSAPPKEKFRPPNKSRHPRPPPAPPVQAFKPTITPSDSDPDSDIEITEEKISSDPSFRNYDIQKLEAIPKSSAFLSMVAGRSNRLLGLGILKKDQISPKKSEAADVSVVDLLSDSDEEAEAIAKVKGSKSSGSSEPVNQKSGAFVNGICNGIGITTTTPSAATAPGRIKFPDSHSTSPAESKKTEEEGHSDNTTTAGKTGKVLHLTTYPAPDILINENEQEIQRSASSSGESSSEIGKRLKRKRFL